MKEKSEFKETVDFIDERNEIFFYWLIIEMISL